MISKEDNIADILRRKPEAGKILFGQGISCCNCPIATDETLEEGCLAHGLDVDKILNVLNKKSKKPTKRRKINTNNNKI